MNRHYGFREPATQHQSVALSALVSLTLLVGAAVMLAMVFG